MPCWYCHKKIGVFRRLVDAKFCCTDHRKKYGTNSARVLRETEDLCVVSDEYDERWSAYAKKAAEKSTKNAASPAQASAFLFAVAIAFILLAMSKGSSSSGRSSEDDQSSAPRGLIGRGSALQRRIGAVLESHTPVTLRDDFATGFTKWEGVAAVKATDWTVQNGYVKPGKLRIWKDSESLANYDMEFVGHIEHKSLNWAFRAADMKNYYGSKLTVGKSGPFANAGLIRFVVLDGRERDRVEVPLPVTLDRNTDYHVSVSVRGSRFLTSIDGQLVSSWTDNRISRGGIGFFADNGEGAALKWVSVSERDSVWGRLVSHFSLITFPAVAPEAGPFSLAPGL